MKLPQRTSHKGTHEREYQVGTVQSSERLELGRFFNIGDWPQRRLAGFPRDPTFHRPRPFEGERHGPAPLPRRPLGRQIEDRLESAPWDDTLGSPDPPHAGRDQDARVVQQDASPTSRGGRPCGCFGSECSMGGRRADYVSNSERVSGAGWPAFCCTDPTLRRVHVSFEQVQQRGALYGL